MSSITDTARDNIIDRLVTATVLVNADAGVSLSDVDLMVLLKNDGTQAVWTFTDASDAVNFWNYVESLRP